MAFWLFQLFPSHSTSSPLAKSVVNVWMFRTDHFSATSLLWLWNKPPPFPNWAVKIASQLPAPSTVVCSPQLEVSHLKFTSPLVTPLLRSSMVSHIPARKSQWPSKPWMTWSMGISPASLPTPHTRYQLCLSPAGLSLVPQTHQAHSHSGPWHVLFPYSRMFFPLTSPGLVPLQFLADAYRELFFDEILLSRLRVNCGSLHSSG